MEQWLQLRLMMGNTDVYYHSEKVSWSSFVPALMIGATIGFVFAAFDSFLNRRHDSNGNATLKRLVRNLFPALNVAVGLIATHTFVHAYQPDVQHMQLVHALGFLPPFIILAGAFLWAGSKSLKHPKALL